MNEKQNQEFLTFKELAEVLHVSRQHIYNLMYRDKNIPKYKFGYTYRVKLDEFVEYFHEK